MRHLLVAVSVASVLVTGAAAVLVPTRAVVETTPITHLSLTGRTVIYAMDENAGRTTCAHLKLWNTASRGLWRFGDSTTRACREEPSTGSGIAAVATSGERVFWVTFAGGNIRESTLWTATPGRRSPRRLADASSDADSVEPAIVLGDGSRDGVAYAVGDTITFVADSGARRFRRRVEGRVRHLVAGEGPGAARVAAALVDGRVVTLALDGRILATSPPGPAVTALELGPAGPVVQRGGSVSVGDRTVVLPAGALMLDALRERVVYARGAEVRSRIVTTGVDVLLRRIAVGTLLRPEFAVDHGGTAWADGSTIRWTASELP